jgi:hypothetical protein
MSTLPSSNTDSVSSIFAFQEFDNTLIVTVLCLVSVTRTSANFSGNNGYALFVLRFYYITHDGDGDDSSEESVGGWNLSVRIDDSESMLESDSLARNSTSEQIVDDDISTVASNGSMASQETIQRSACTSDDNNSFAGNAGCYP